MSRKIFGRRDYISPTTTYGFNPLRCISGGSYTHTYTHIHTRVYTRTLIHTHTQSTHIHESLVSLYPIVSKWCFHKR